MKFQVIFTGGVVIWILSAFWALFLTGVHILFHCKCIYTNNQLWGGMLIVALAGLTISVVEIVYLAKESGAEEITTQTILYFFFILDFVANLGFAFKFKFCPQKC